MSNPNKTIADIVDEKRARANKIESATGGMPNQFQRKLIADLRAEADELEAAVKRELERAVAEALTVGGMVEAARKSEMSKNVSKNVADFGQLGNAAAMHEALESIADNLERRLFAKYPSSATDEWMWQKANSALAAPPRNCDVGTPEEQWTRIRAFCKRHKTGLRCVDCPVNGIFPKNCALIWAQMPYEGGAK